jgi:hypothetical protein
MQLEKERTKMQSKKQYLLEALLEGSALVLVNQDGMPTALTLDNLYGLVSIEDNNITFLMQSIKNENDLGEEIAWTFNTDDIYLLKANGEDGEKTSFWMDKYPHKDLLKGITKVNTFINDKVLASHDLKNKLPPDMFEKIVDTIELLVDPENENEVFDCDTEEDSDIFFLLEEYLLSSKGYLALKDMYVPIALS